MHLPLPSTPRETQPKLKLNPNLPVLIPPFSVAAKSSFNIFADSPCLDSASKLLPANFAFGTLVPRLSAPALFPRLPSPGQPAVLPSPHSSLRRASITVVLHHHHRRSNLIVNRHSSPSFHHRHLLLHSNSTNSKTMKTKQV